MNDPSEFTRMLKARDWHHLMPLIYDMLYKKAHRLNKYNETLNTTALIGELYLELVDLSQSDLNDRNHFYGLAVTVMRRIIIDYARKKSTKKRGGFAIITSLNTLGDIATEDEAAGIAMHLDKALKKLQEVDERKVKVVESRIFGGFSVKETAEILGVSEATVKRDFAFALIWLRREIKLQGE